MSLNYDPTCYIPEESHPSHNRGAIIASLRTATSEEGVDGQNEFRQTLHHPVCFGLIAALLHCISCVGGVPKASGPQYSPYRGTVIYTFASLAGVTQHLDVSTLAGLFATSHQTGIHTNKRSNDLLVDIVIGFSPLGDSAARKASILKKNISDGLVRASRGFRTT